MKRRGNKSAKVPNVKLRPAQPGALSHRREEEDSWSSQCLVQDTQAMNDSSSVFGLIPRPFRGIVLCATGVMDKPTLFKQAMELGATSSSAFTDRVTHLIAEDHGGAKYMCALERKIPIMLPSWITSSYNIWLKGDDVDMQLSLDQHRLPIFRDVVICPSGITDIVRRTQINKLITLHQGTYLKNLERPVKVTHLLCSGDEETDKMHYAEKFNERKEAKIHLVWEEWFWDSLEFGGRFEEARYQVRRPRPERKALPDISTLPPPSSILSSKDSYHDLSNAPPNQSRPPPGNGDDPDEELAAVKRVPALTLKLWESLLRPRGYEITTDGELLRSPSKSQGTDGSRKTPTSPLANANMADEDSGFVVGQNYKGSKSIISSFRRANSFAPPRESSAGPSQRQPFRRLASGGNGAVEVAEDAMDTPGAGPSGQSSSPSTSSLFAGLRFRALGEARCGIVRNAVEKGGGKLVAADDDAEVDYIIVRLLSGSKIFRSEAEENEKKKYRTECWLERCIFEEKLCDPSEHVSYVPLGIEIPISGAERVVLSFSGLDESEKHFTRRLLRALGIELAPNFSRQATHLLCPEGMGAKYDKALEWGIPVVNMGWLEEMSTTGLIPAVDRFLVGGSSASPQQSAVVLVPETLDAFDMAVDMKGKGKAIESSNDGTMMKEITNSQANESAPLRPTQQSDVLPLRDLERRETATSSFGAASALLGGGSLSRSFSSIKHPPPSLPAESLEYITRPPTRAPSVSTSNHSQVEPGASKSPDHSHTPSNTTPRRQTQAEIERERKQMRIPSSKSPSPLKVAPVSRDVTKALQDSLTTLLGKRKSEEGDETGKGAARGGKRARPVRSKPQTRQGSLQQPLPEKEPVPLHVYDNYHDNDELNLSEGAVYDEYEGAVEESMRVTYEDPGQRDEKKRLMSLFGSQDDEGKNGKKSGRGKASRKSSRIAGF